MNRFVMLSVILCAVSASAGEIVTHSEVAYARAHFEQACERMEKQVEAARAQLDYQLEHALAERARALRERGSRETFQAAAAQAGLPTEGEAFERAYAASRARLQQEYDAEIESVRYTYEEALARLDVRRAEKLLSILAAYRKSLTLMEEQLRAARRINEMKRIRAERRRAEQLPEVRDARRLIEAQGGGRGE